jgi:limonene-1,2-epoxide hydrolase
MGAENEAAARALFAELEGEQQDTAQVERVIGRLAPEARYQIFAWEEPFVGHDAIRAELLRQAAILRDVRLEIVTIGSADNVVFMERIDSMLLRGKPLTCHIAAVLKIDTDGKIAAWREYLDSREVSVQVGSA